AVSFQGILEHAAGEASILRLLIRPRARRSDSQSRLAHRFCDNPRLVRATISTCGAKYRRRDLRCCRPNELRPEYRDRVPKTLWPVRKQTNIVPDSRRRN